jgi:ABC-type uncharacterized transport system substrate-binding protein
MGWISTGLEISCTTGERLYPLYAVNHQTQDIKCGGLGAVGSNNALERLPIIPRENRAATYVDNILQETKPADLPVEQVTKSELIINLKTTEAPGLTMPSRILFQADEVIR